MSVANHAMTDRAKVAVLISGRGSNMTALVDAAKAPDCPYEVVLVLSNKPEAEGLALAAEAGVPTLAIDHRPFGADREAHERALDAALREAGAEYVALAGYMRVLTPFLVEAWAGRMINIHPSLLPKYPGLDTHRRAIEAGDTEAGCSVHLVTAGVDEGHILARGGVRIEPGDTAETLAARVLEVEHRLYPEALADFIGGRLHYLYNSPFFDWLPDYSAPSRSLNELEGHGPAKPHPDDTPLMRDVELSYATPVRDLTCSQVNELAGQRFGLKWLAEPICRFVLRYPLATLEYYPGDLTLNVLRDIDEYLSHAPALARQVATADYAWMKAELVDDGIIADALDIAAVARAAATLH